MRLIGLLIASVFVFSLGFLAFHTALAQVPPKGAGYPYNLPFDYREDSVYRLPPNAKPGLTAVVLQMAYAEAQIRNPAAWDNYDGIWVPVEVELVYSKQPLDTANWLTPFHNLTKRRVESLFALDSALRSADIKWTLVAQTKAKVKDEAKQLFHGFVVYYKTIPPKTPPPKPSDMFALEMQLLKNKQRAEAALDTVKKQINGETALKDSLIFNVIARRPDWQNLLVVADWTASMYPYGAELIRWQQIHQTAKLIKYLCFFNDGDDAIRLREVVESGSFSSLLQAYNKLQESKPLGEVGGIYYADPASMQSILSTMRTVMLAGTGGDDPENDLEAIIKAEFQYANSFGSLVLIADAGSDVRDMALLPQVRVPVNVVLCGVGNLKKPPIAIPDYLKIAHDTGGSVAWDDGDVRFGPDLQLNPSLATDGIRIGSLTYLRDPKTGKWQPL